MDVLHIRKVAVVGAGIMGVGIAHGFAQAGLHVDIVDVSLEALGQCRKQIANNLRTFHEFELLNESPTSIMQRIVYHQASDLSDALEGCDFVVEALPENLRIKQSLFRQLDVLPAKVILASNTSSLTITDLGKEMESAQRLVGLHYFNPAHIIPAVEIHRGLATADENIAITKALMTRIGKQPVLVRKEVPGFIINRLTGAMEREIDYLLDEGVVSPEDLDIAVKASYGFRLACLGPMEAEDMIGLDTAARASGNIFPTLSNASEPSPQLTKKVEAGELGIKTGKGWYHYPENEAKLTLDKTNRRLLRQLALFGSES